MSRQSHARAARDTTFGGLSGEDVSRSCRKRARRHHDLARIEKASRNIRRRSRRQVRDLGGVSRGWRDTRNGETLDK